MRRDFDDFDVNCDHIPVVDRNRGDSGHGVVGAVNDHQFNTTDVSVIVKTDLITEKYVKRYEKEWRGNQISG